MSGHVRENLAVPVDVGHEIVSRPARLVTPLGSDWRAYLVFRVLTQRHETRVAPAVAAAKADARPGCCGHDRQPGEDVPGILGGLQQSGHHVRNEYSYQGGVGLQGEISPLSSSNAGT